MGYQTNSTFSMFFSSENDGVFDEHNQNQNFDPYYNNNYNNNLSSSSSSLSSVDCTLSLATPSSRLSDETNDNGTWNFFQSKTTPFKKSSGDVNVGRRCASCDTTSTPLWRNGPRGPKSLCNACGIRFKKEERRATARNLTVSGGASSAAGIPAAEYPYNGGGNYYNHHRVNYFSPAPENEYPYVDDVRYHDSDVTTASFLSWN